MADKVQNITINYKFNTAEIDRANAILNRANATSNTLQGSGSKAGQVLSNSFSQARQSIAAMQTQLVRLKTQIEVSSDPKRVAELSAQYKALKTQMDAASKSALGMGNAMKTTNQNTQSAAQGFGQLFTAVKLFVTAGLVKEIFDATLAMASLSGKVEGVDRAFQKQVPNSIRLLDDLRKATQGTATDLDLMQKTLQAKNLGIDIQQLPVFFEFAAIRAQQTGVSVEYLTDAIVNGLGRKSTRVLDNLGISASRIKDEFKGVSLETLSVGQVTVGVGNIMREELAKMGEYADTAATKVQQFGVSIDNLKVQASEFATQEGGIIDFLKGYADSFALLFEAQNKDISVQELANQKRIEQIALISEAEYAKRVLTGTQEENIKSIEEEIAAITKELGIWGKMRDAAKERIELVQDMPGWSNQAEVGGLREQLALEVKLRDAHLEDIQIDQVMLKLLYQRLAAMKGINEEGEKEASGIISRKKKQIEDLQKQIELTNNLNDISRYETDQFGNTTLKAGKLIVQLEILQAELGDLQRTFSEIDIKPLDLKLEEETKGLFEFEANIKRIEVAMQNIANAKLTPPPTTVADVDTFWTEFGDHLRDNWRDITADAIDFQADMINNLLEAEIDSMNAQLDQTKDFYAQQQTLAGDNARAKSELRVKEDRETAALEKKIFEREKKLRKAQAVVDGAAAVIKAFVTAPNVYVAIIQAAFIAAKTLAQISIINREKGYAKGVIDLKGPGTGTSDSIPARLSKGESVMTAWETRHAGDVLKAVRAKKLDNKVLKDLRQGRSAIHSESFNDQGIIKAIKDNRPPDYVEHAGIVYRVEKKNDTYLRKIRAKSVRL